MVTDYLGTPASTLATSASLPLSRFALVGLLVSHAVQYAFIRLSLTESNLVRLCTPTALMVMMNHMHRQRYKHLVNPGASKKSVSPIDRDRLHSPLFMRLTRARATLISVGHSLSRSRLRPRPRLRLLKLIQLLPLALIRLHA